MARRYKVKNTKHGTFLGSPHIFGNGPTDQLWIWTSKEADAHQFNSRAEAKQLLRNGGGKPTLENITFIPV